MARRTIYIGREEFDRRAAMLREPRPEDGMPREFAEKIQSFEDLEAAMYRLFGHEPPTGDHLPDDEAGA